MSKKFTNFLTLLSYFFLGVGTLTNVASTLFGKNVVHLTANQLISLGIWTGLPWSAKIMFSSVIDALKIFKSQRKSYLILASLLGIASSLAMMDASGSHSWLFSALGEYTSLLLIGLAGTISIVISRLLLDVLVVENARDDHEKAKLQLHSRNVYIFGGLVGAALSGILASHLNLPIIFGISAISPLMVLFMSLVSKYEEPEHIGEKKMVGIGVLFVLATTFLGLLLSDTWSQLVVFLLSLTLFGGLLVKQLTHLDLKSKISFLVTLTALFLFRTNPSAGVAGTWYYMDVWGFDANFLGMLSTIGYATSVAAMILFRNFLVKKEKIASVLIWSTLGLLILGLPDLMVYYGYTFGIAPKHLILVDSASADILSQVAMIPLGIVIALNVPEQGKVTYFALTASLMNAALLASEIIKKFLNSIFVVERGHYENLGKLFIWSLLVSVVLSVIGIVFIKVNQKIDAKGQV